MNKKNAKRIIEIISTHLEQKNYVVFIFQIEF